MCAHPLSYHRCIHASIQPYHWLLKRLAIEDVAVVGGVARNKDSCYPEQELGFNSCPEIRTLAALGAAVLAKKYEKVMKWGSNTGLIRLRDIMLTASIDIVHGLPKLRLERCKLLFSYIGIPSRKRSHPKPPWPKR